MAQRVGVPGQGVTILGGSGGLPFSPTNPLPTQQIGLSFTAAQLGITTPLVIPVGTTFLSGLIDISGWRAGRLYVQASTPGGGTFGYGMVACDASGNNLNTIAVANAGTGAQQQMVLFVNQIYTGNFFHNLGVLQGAVGAVGPSPFPGSFMRISLSNTGVGPTTVNNVNLFLSQ